MRQLHVVIGHRLAKLVPTVRFLMVDESLGINRALAELESTLATVIGRRQTKNCHQVQPASTFFFRLTGSQAGGRGDSRQGNDSQARKLPHRLKVSLRFHRAGAHVWLAAERRTVS